GIGHALEALPRLAFYAPDAIFAVADGDARDTPRKRRIETNAVDVQLRIEENPHAELTEAIFIACPVRRLRLQSFRLDVNAVEGLHRRDGIALREGTRPEKRALGSGETRGLTKRDHRD